MEELSFNEKLVYSTLVSHVLTSRSELYSEDGKLYLGLLRSTLHYNEGILDMPSINISKLAIQVKMPRMSVRSILNKLKHKYLITNDAIKIDQQLIDGGYFVVAKNTGLSGIQLVFYSYLLDLAHKYNSIISTWASTIAQRMNISKHNAQCLISILHTKGFVERLPDGKLKIKSVGEAISASPT